MIQYYGKLPLQIRMINKLTKSSTSFEEGMKNNYVDFRLLQLVTLGRLSPTIVTVFVVR